MSREHQATVNVVYTHIWSAQGGVTVARALVEPPRDGTKSIALAFSFVSPHEMVFSRAKGRALSKGRLGLGKSITVTTADDGRPVKDIIYNILRDETCWMSLGKKAPKWWRKFIEAIDMGMSFNPTENLHLFSLLDAIPLKAGIRIPPHPDITDADIFTMARTINKHCYGQTMRTVPQSWK